MAPGSGVGSRPFGGRVDSVDSVAKGKLGGSDRQGPGHEGSRGPAPRGAHQSVILRIFCPICSPQ